MEDNLPSEWMTDPSFVQMFQQYLQQYASSSGLMDQLNAEQKGL